MGEGEVLPQLFNIQYSLFTTTRYGGIAQLGEHLLCKQGVSGSIPLISTMDGNIQRTL